jgi:hypothetical protein
MKGRESDLHPTEGKLIAERLKSENLQKRLNELAPKRKAKFTLLYHNRVLDR